MSDSLQPEIETQTEPGPQPHAPVNNSLFGLTRSHFKYKDNPEEPPNWLPISLRPFFLLGFAVMSTLLAIAAEVALWASQQDFGPWSEEYSYSRSILGQFFGMFVVVVYGQFYEALDLIVKEMEPFHHLSNPYGAEAAKCMTIDYFGSSIYVAPFKAAYHRHWAVVYSSICGLLATNLLPIMAAGMFGMDYDTNPMHATYAHVFAGLALVLAIFTIVLHYVISHRSSGLLHYPNTLEAMVDLSTGLRNDNSLYEYFRSLVPDENISEKELASILEKSMFKSRRRSPEVGAPIDILRTGSSTPSEPWLPSWLSRTWDSTLQFVNRSTRYLWSDNHPVWFQRIPLTGVIIVLLTLFILANGQPPWAVKYSFFQYIGNVRFARSSVSSIVSTGIFLQIHKNARLMEPFYQLSRTDGAPWEVINLREDWPFQDIYHGVKSLFRLRNKRLEDTTMLFITLGNYSSALFVVTWNSLAFTEYGTPGSGYWVILGLQIVTEIFMLLALLVVFLYRSRPILPRMPLTLASKLLYVYTTDIPSKRYVDYQEWKRNAPDISVDSYSLNERSVTPESYRDEYSKTIAEFCRLYELLYGPSTEEYSVHEISPHGLLNSPENHPNASGIPNTQSSQSTIDTGSLPPRTGDPEKQQSSLHCGFGHFEGRDRYMHLGVCLIESRTAVWCPTKNLPESSSTMNEN